MPRTPLPSAESRVRKARLAANRAVQLAHAELMNDAHHRATRTRRAYQAKAEGLDRVVEILNGKSR